MSTPKILEEEAISMIELKSEISKIKRKDKELNFRANKTDEYLKQFVHISVKDSEELYAKLEKLNIPRLKEMHIKKIIDIMPKKVEDVKVVLEAYPITVNNENMKKIAAVVAEFA